MQAERENNEAELEKTRGAQAAEATKRPVSKSKQGRRAIHREKPRRPRRLARMREQLAEAHATRDRRVKSTL